MIAHVLNACDAIGACILRVSEQIGDFCIFMGRVITTAYYTPIRWRRVVQHMYTIGVRSLSIIALTGLFSGLALALQSYIGFSRVGAEDFIGLIVALGIARELAPVMTGLMTAGRAGSAITAEIGSMRISEQIDALTTLGIDPFGYLIVPRIIASTCVLPCVTIFAMACGVAGGYVFCIYGLHLGHDTFFHTIHEGMQLADIYGGLIKTACFGFLVAWVACYNGYTASGGARGVGNATTETVITASMLVLIANYVLSALMFETGIG